ncbi:MAG: hypothetical protein PHN88_01755 [Ignavibacteria bacterium]|nr:hypothetical protein [Ignavibacteria bacterium]
MVKSSVIYLLVFSFLLAGCYTTDNYSDTPQNIISGKSDIERSEDYVLDSLTLKDGKIMKFKDSFSEFLNCNYDGCSKLAVGKLIRMYNDKSSGYMYSNDITYKKSVPDTIDVSKISLMFYSKKNTNYIPYIVVGGVVIAAAVSLIITLLSLRGLGGGTPH